LCWTISTSGSTATTGEPSSFSPCALLSPPSRHSISETYCLGCPNGCPLFRCPRALTRPHWPCLRCHCRSEWPRCHPLACRRGRGSAKVASICPSQPAGLCPAAPCPGGLRHLAREPLDSLRAHLPPANDQRGHAGQRGLRPCTGLARLFPFTCSITFLRRASWSGKVNGEVSLGGMMRKRWRHGVKGGQESRW